jgi:hypothetical protein
VEAGDRCIYPCSSFQDGNTEKVARDREVKDLTYFDSRGDKGRSRGGRKRERGEVKRLQELTSYQFPVTSHLPPLGLLCSTDDRSKIDQQIGTWKIYKMIIRHYQSINMWIVHRSAFSSPSPATMLRLKHITSSRELPPIPSSGYTGSISRHSLYPVTSFSAVQL